MIESVQVVKYHQLCVRDRSLPVGSGVFLPTSIVKPILENKRITINNTTCLFITVDSLKQLSPARGEEAVMGELIMGGSENQTKKNQFLSLSKINDRLNKIFLGEGIKIYGTVNITSSEIERDCLISGDCPDEEFKKLLRGDGLEPQTTVVDSMIGPGLQIMNSNIVGCNIMGNPAYNGDGNPFSVFMSSILERSSFAGRFETSRSKISEFALVNKFLYPINLDNQEMVAGSGVERRIIFAEDQAKDNKTSST